MGKKRHFYIIQYSQEFTFSPSAKSHLLASSLLLFDSYQPRERSPTRASSVIHTWSHPTASFQPVPISHSWLPATDDRSVALIRIHNSLMIMSMFKFDLCNIYSILFSPLKVTNNSGVHVICDKSTETAESPCKTYRDKNLKRFRVRDERKTRSLTLSGKQTRGEKSSRSTADLYGLIKRGNECRVGKMLCSSSMNAILFKRANVPQKWVDVNNIDLNRLIVKSVNIYKLVWVTLRIITPPHYTPAWKDTSLNTQQGRTVFEARYG